MENGDTYRSAVQGVVVRHMRISNSGGEGILLRYFVTGCRIHHCKIISTGCYDFKFQKADRGIKNGEGVCKFIGTFLSRVPGQPGSSCECMHALE